MFTKLYSFKSRMERRKVRNMLKSLQAWKSRGFSDNSPPFIKQGMFIKHGVEGAKWVETGTYLGETTDFLASRFPFVHSVEPQNDLAARAKEKFEGRNVCIHHGTSEQVLPKLLSELSGDINFWLDGHYSAGITYRGEQDCPVVDELRAIENNLKNFGDIRILIDDIRYFLSENRREFNYPDVMELISWADKNQFFWRIEHDIFVMKRMLS